MAARNAADASENAKNVASPSVETCKPPAAVHASIMIR
jgi:hypothetical protein